MKLQSWPDRPNPIWSRSAGCGDVEIAGITADSRQVRPGWLFAALAGAKADGAQLHADAIAKGAAAVLAQARTPRSPVPAHVALLTRSRAAPGAGPDGGALLSAPAGDHRRRHRHQRQDLGRRLHAADLRRARPQGGLARHHRPGQARRQRLRRADDARSGHAAPDAGGAGAEGVTHLAFEASSHGLDQYRLDGVRAEGRRPSPTSAATISTIIPTMEAYLAAKLRLFTELLPPDGTAVVNADAEHAAQVIAAARDARASPS